MTSGPILGSIGRAENILKGQRRTFGIIVTNAAGARQNMSGWTMVFRLYRYMGDTNTPLVTISGANIQLVSTLADATLDKMVVTLDNNTLDAAPVGKNYFKASRTDADNEGDVRHGDFWIMG